MIIRSGDVQIHNPMCSHVKRHYVETSRSNKNDRRTLLSKILKQILVGDNVQSPAGA